MTGTFVEEKTSPMMMQWHACKKAAKDAVLLFRMGDFYEAFYDDAALIAKELELTLTKRQEIPMSGIPHHSSEPYIDRLVSKGYRVAIAEQMEDPKQAKGIVKREVVRIVSPGSLLTSALLSEKNNNYFVSITRVGTLFGIAVLDLSTGEFRVIEFDNESDLMNELFRLRPSEILCSHKFKDKHTALLNEANQSFNCPVNTYEDWKFDHQIAHDFLTSHFKILSLDGFGLTGMVSAINVAGALLSYVQDVLCFPIQHIREIAPYNTRHFMSLDRSTQRNLELTESLSDHGKKMTLLSVLDRTLTPMGGRLLRRWIKQPLMDPESINQRQEVVELFTKNPQILERLSQELDKVRDLERLTMRITTGYASPRDLVALRYSLEPLPYLKELLSAFSHLPQLLQEDNTNIKPLPEIVELIKKAIVDEPPMRITEGRIFRDGYHAQLDELRVICHDSRSWIARYQNDIREKTGIKTLKVGFTKMFGYYIEVSKGQADRMPETFQRRQTLVNAERFISPELKDYETKVLTAEERIGAIENELFITLRDQIAAYCKDIFAIAQAIARIDVLQSLASAARTMGYVRPLVDSSQKLHIQDGRHPVIEAAYIGEKFISNDTEMDDEGNRLLLITGPNMAGKSTYIRQVALIVIMAQMGSFVPAKKAHIGIIDKVFSRIGASDDLSRGQSTFMVEMTETANILNNVTSRSLVILDEIGRGTSTYDGISIAWSVAEYLLTCEGRTAKTLFATHYWELTKLEEKVPGAVNYNVAVHESEDNIVFLRKIIKGGTDKSYGIHVGRLAGLPNIVIQRSKEILLHLEENANRKNAFEPSTPKRSTASKRHIAPINEMQLTFFG